MTFNDSKYLKEDSKEEKILLYTLLLIFFFTVLICVIWWSFNYRIKHIKPGNFPDTQIEQPVHAPDAGAMETGVNF